MSFEVLNISRKSTWKEQLDRIQPSAKDIYFYPEYYELDSTHRKDTEIRCFLFRDSGDIALCPFFISPVDSLGVLSTRRAFYDIQGAYGYNGIISTSMSNGFLKEFNSAFEYYCKKKGIIAEFIRFHPLLRNHTAGFDFKNVLFNRTVVYVDLRDDIDFIRLNSYSSKNRNMIRKARRNGLIVKISDSEDARARFSDMYEKTMRAVGAKSFYFFGKTYFSALNEFLKGNYSIVEVYSGDAPVSSALILYHGNYAHYHLSARDFSCSSAGAGNLALDGAVEFLKNRGCSLFCLGGGLTEGDSLFKFKRSFSNKTADFFIGGKIHDTEAYTRLTERWEELNPEKAEKYASYLLKYRE